MKAMLPHRYPERAFSVTYALKDIGYALERAAAAGHTEEYFPVVAKVV